MAQDMLPMILTAKEHTQKLHLAFLRVRDEVKDRTLFCDMAQTFHDMGHKCALKRCRAKSCDGVFDSVQPRHRARKCMPWVIPQINISEVEVIKQLLKIVRTLRAAQDVIVQGRDAFVQSWRPFAAGPVLRG